MNDSTSNNTCPSCGYCQHCGRGGYVGPTIYPHYPQPYPWYPYYYTSGGVAPLTVGTFSSTDIKFTGN